MTRLHEPSSPTKVLIAAFLGTVLEWYDFFLYGTAAALVFGKLFFPNVTPIAGLLAAFGTYAVGFFARPFGGILCGHVGDRVGRKRLLTLTLTLMGVSTCAIGLLPTYETVGLAAPILLVVCRILQGIALGGEYGAAVLMIVEQKGQQHRGLRASAAQAGVPVGMVLATLVFRFVASKGDAAFLSWGWRVPFLLGSLIAAVGVIVRRQLSETPMFVELEKRCEAPMRAVIRNQWRRILTVIGARLPENASYYIFSVFALSYGTSALGLSKNVMLNSVLIASAVQFVTIPIFAHLADRLGRKPVYLFGLVSLIGFAYPFFLILRTGNSGWIIAGMICALAVVHAPMYAIQGAFFSEMFETDVRYSGVSLGIQISAPLAGGLAPLIATALLSRSGGSPWSVAGYMIVLAVLGIVAILCAPETRRVVLR